MWRVQLVVLLLVVLLAAATGNGQTIPVTCPHMEVANPLQLLCDPTCDRRVQFPGQCERNSQCVCMLGYVRQVSGGRCVPFLECPPAGTKTIAPPPPSPPSNGVMPKMLRL